MLTLVSAAQEPLDGHPVLAGLQDDAARSLAQLFKLLADETRIRILYYLMQKPELNVCTLCGLLAQSQPAVSHHLALLRSAGVIESRRDGKHNFYRLVPKRCEQYLDCVFGITDGQKRQIRVDEAILTYGRDGQPVAGQLMTGQPVA